MSRVEKAELNWKDNHNDASPATFSCAFHEYTLDVIYPNLQRKNLCVIVVMDKKVTHERQPIHSFFLNGSDIDWYNFTEVAHEWYVKEHKRKTLKNLTAFETHEWYVKEHKRKTLKNDFYSLMAEEKRLLDELDSIRNRKTIVKNELSKWES